MDFPLISYRDPLFSIMMLMVVIFIVSYTNYLWSKYKKKSEKKELDKFLDGFQSAKNEKDYSTLLQTNPEAINSMMLLGSIYYKSSDYEESIKIYLVLLDFVKNKEQRVEILSMLGKTYHKAGFLHRSRNILKEALKLKARNPEVLEVLLAILERLKEYDSGFDTLESLEELGKDVEKERHFLEVFLIIENSTLEENEKIQKLKEHLKKYSYTAHVVIEFLFTTSNKDAWEMIKHVEITSIIDILWIASLQNADFDYIQNNKILSDLYSAKGVIKNSKQSDMFELDILIKLQNKREIADLSFEYNCDNCKQVFPIYFHRCPNCLTVDSCKVEPNLTKKFQLSMMNELT